MIAEPNKKSPFLASEVKLLVTQSYLTLCNPMDYNPPGSSIQEILQARLLEWVAIPFSGGSSPPRDQIPRIPARDLLHCRQIIYHLSYWGSPSYQGLSQWKAMGFLFTIALPTSFSSLRMCSWGFPGGTVVKNLLANSGDTGSIPELGRSHMPWSN